ncbi:unnamed protein product [Vitrella brassicaformis CCMP3155]|uniref:Uncharacterized protein n=1 Tax=Vitrella brassicaformis (strain CCMP3155) TaxID=1169540 RepID=A0A0G4F977_VITBC|nr:unnamed protein product [Vitrella brassicaformis CCMP3155]|eukprot:CEM08788.1 unnamed protein product [Vitrella brassicaformis CCMP3155]
MMTCVPDGPIPQTHFNWDGVCDKKGCGGGKKYYMHVERKPNHPAESDPSSRKDGMGPRSTLRCTENRADDGRDLMGRLQERVQMFERAEREWLKHFARLRGFEDLSAHSTPNDCIEGRGVASMSKHEASHWVRQLVETHQELKAMDRFSK